MLHEKMVRSCFAKLCNNTRYKAVGVTDCKNVPFYRFPSDPKLRQEWIQALITLNGQENALNLPKMASLCAEHFEPNCLEKIGLLPIRLKPHSVPTIFPHTKNKSKAPVQSSNDIVTTPSPVEIPVTPMTSERKMRYPGDISDNILEEMTPRGLKEYVRLLKEACKKKDSTIKRLRTEQTRQKKKIKSLQGLLSNLKEKNCFLQIPIM